MTQHDPHVSLCQMRDHAREAMQLAQGSTREGFLADRTINLAVVRLLEIVGEAASRIPQSERDKYPQIPWGQVVGLRNRLAHGYDRVDLEIVWQIVTRHLPSLVTIHGVVSMLLCFL